MEVQQILQQQVPLHTFGVQHKLVLRFLYHQQQTQHILLLEQQMGVQITQR